jgi:hypothetical protein
LPYKLTDAIRFLLFVVFLLVNFQFEDNSFPYNAIIFGRLMVGLFNGRIFLDELFLYINLNCFKILFDVLFYYLNIYIQF